MDLLARCEWHLQPESVDPHSLYRLADQVHLDTADLHFVEGAMAKPLEIELAAELAVDARLRGDRIRNTTVGDDTGSGPGILPPGYLSGGWHY